MAQRPQGSGFVVAGWIVFSIVTLLLVFALLLAVDGSDSSGCRGLAIMGVLTSMIMVGVDGARHDISLLKRSSLPLTGLERTTTANWVVGVWLIWIVFFPLYLAKRKKLVAAAWETRTFGYYRS